MQGTDHVEQSPSWETDSCSADQTLTAMDGSKWFIILTWTTKNVLRNWLLFSCSDFNCSGWIQMLDYFDLTNQ
jgi:hypothetical protein